ncbi:MAG: hypothetical protein IMF09_11215 [Proteobacteria bacterium]|nr:hypothetical protein [Pseudomonadota bacterium]
MSNNQRDNGDPAMDTATCNNEYTIEQALADVDAYVRGKLETARKNSFELFLLSNPQLQDEVETALIARVGLIELGKQQVLSGIESDGTGSKQPSFLQRLFSGIQPVPAFATAAILVITITVGSVMFKDNDSPLLAQLQAPAGQLQTVTLPNVRAGLTGSFQPLAVLDKNANGGWMMMELELSFPEFERYNIEIISWSDKSRLVALSSLRPDAKDNLVFALHASELPTGDYVARVVYDNGTKEELIANYAFSVEAGKGNSI